jgi:hypothetical protein
MNKNLIETETSHAKIRKQQERFTFSFNKVIAFENSSVAFSNSLILNASFPFSFNSITAEIMDDI